MKKRKNMANWSKSSDRKSRVRRNYKRIRNT